MMTVMTIAMTATITAKANKRRKWRKEPRGYFFFGGADSQIDV